MRFLRFPECIQFIEGIDENILVDTQTEPGKKGFRIVRAYNKLCAAALGIPRDPHGTMYIQFDGHTISLGRHADWDMILQADIPEGTKKRTRTTYCGTKPIYG